MARGSGMKVRCKLGCHALDYPDIELTGHGDKYDANKDRAPHTLFMVHFSLFPRPTPGKYNKRHHSIPEQP